MKKKEKSTLVVLLTIIFLSTFIIFPPLFRSLFEEMEVYEEMHSELLVLNCTKDVALENIRASARAVYANGEFRNTMLTFIYMPELSELELAESEYSALLEIEEFRNILDINLEEIDDRVTIRLDASHSIHESELIRNHIQDIDSLRNHYELLGFVCRLES